MAIPRKRRSSPALPIIRTIPWDCRRTNFCAYVRKSWRPITAKPSPTFSRPESFLDRDADIVRVAEAPVTVAFAPQQSAAIVKEIVGAIAAARRRLLVASVVLSSGPILAALSEAIDRGLQLGGIYDGPQMDQVRRQWVAAHVGADKINTWGKISNHLDR